MAKIADDFKRDFAAANKLRLRWWAILPLIVGATLACAAFDHFGRLNEFLPAINIAGILALIIVVKRNLIGRLWFWITLIIVAVLHVLLILYVPWTNRWVPAVAIAVIASLDFCAILGMIEVIGRLMDRPKTAE